MDHDHDMNPTNPSCAAIMDICHEADVGPGPAHECHETAHADVEAPCAMVKTQCIATCQAALDAGAD